jgi:predicted  nucleic acid-binding Zn-ribbon protein
LSVYENRLNALEKDIATIKQDVIYKLDETNSAVTIVKGVIGTVAQDVKVMRSQLKTMDLRLEGVEIHLSRLEDQQVLQGQDIKDIKRRLDDQDKKLDAILALLQNKP